ncbi:MAG: Rab family GTPase [Candidatus Thorarchaeota archaeon]
MEYLEYIKIEKKVRKILILGSGAVGKTSLTKVLKTNIPTKEMGDNCEYHRTLFVEIDQFKTANKDGTFQVFDLAGQLDLPIHATRDTARFAFSGVDLVCFVLANDNVQSLMDLNEWVNITKEYYNNAKISVPPFILIKNKMDLNCAYDDTLVDFIKPNFEAYFEISCFDGKGINDLRQWFDDFYTLCNTQK